MSEESKKTAREFCDKYGIPYEELDNLFIKLNKVLLLNMVERLKDRFDDIIESIIEEIEESD